MNNRPKHAGFLKEIHFLFEKIAIFYKTLDTGVLEVPDCESDIRF